jgi:hypothetical protein
LFAPILTRELLYPAVTSGKEHLTVMAAEAVPNVTPEYPGTPAVA